jgi:L-lactate utilization protein LutB
MKINIKSTLEKIANQVFTAKTADEAKQIIVSHVSESQVNEIDKNKMITDVNALKNLIALVVVVISVEIIPVYPL